MRSLNGSCNVCPAVVSPNQQIEASTCPPISHNDVFVVEDLKNLVRREAMATNLLLIVVIKE